MQNGTPPAPASDRDGGYESGERSDEETLSEAHGDHVQQPRVQQQDTFQHWEFGIKVDISEFYDGIEVDEFLNWLATVEEILDYKEVPDNKSVPLVATRLCGRSATWWQQQLKQKRIR